MLLHYALLYHLDVIAFALFVGLLAWTAHRRVPEEVAESPYPRPYVATLAAIVLVGIAAAELSGERERRNLADVLRGLAPTFASELMALGLARMGPDTPADDPDYLRMIEAQKRWLSANHSVKDIYTAVLTRDDRVLLIVDSENDYNSDGDFDDPMEHRVPAGEELEDVFGEFHAAMLGDLTFGENPHQDAWGFWVSAYENPGNNVDGLPIMVGLDYEAMEWLTQIQLQRGLVLVLFLLMTGACVGIGRNARLTRFDVIRERRTREQLEIASQTAEAANTAKGAFLASISHEIRTPMNGVLGMLELLGATPLTDEQSEYIETAYRSGKALLEILNDVLDYSKVEAGMLHIETLPANIRNLLQDITSLHTAIARSRGLSTSMHVAPDVPEILRCDP
ncbi:MAG: histidine kinase dimerization/phospho-acceptor domain-containing protein, partial [Gammaproteobacteria bacterium]